jgi:hypothetical protein
MEGWHHTSAGYTESEQEEHLVRAQLGFMSDDTSKAWEKQVQSYQLITKFKENTIVAYRKVG